MKTRLVEPDQVIIHNLAKVTKDDSMFLIAKGECKAIIVDQKEDSDDEESDKHEHEMKIDPNVKLLRPGSYFGEISIIFGCERSAQVIATKYCTLAELTISAYRELVTILPNI